MAPTLETPPTRYYIVHLIGEDGVLTECTIRADTVCEPTKPTEKWMVFKRDGTIVGKVHMHRLAAWHIREEA